MASSSAIGTLRDNQIYQYSLVNALMDGVCETGITAKKLARSGNQGLGTFHRMRGELFMLEGKIFQLRPGGSVIEVSPDAQIPFAMSTQFAPSQTHEIDLDTKDDIRAVLEKHLSNTKNLFRTYRITGTFEYLKCRTVEGQEYKGQSLKEVGAAQSTEVFQGVEGTIIGFSAPLNWQGFTVAGEHSHFLSADCRSGGHVLEVRARGISMGIATCSDVHLELPMNEAFNAAQLSTDSAGLIEVEG